MFEENLQYSKVESSTLKARSLFFMLAKTVYLLLGGVFIADPLLVLLWKRGAGDAETGREGAVCKEKYSSFLAWNLLNAVCMPTVIAILKHRAIVRLLQRLLGKLLTSF